MSEAALRQRQRAERILTAAEGLFAHFGYDKTTMEDIAREADVSKGALYLHFKGKEDLFDALMQRENDLLQEAVLTRLEAEGNALSIFSVFRHSIEASMERPLLRALLTGNRRVLGDYIMRLKHSFHYSQVVGYGQDFVVHMQQAGMIRADVDPDVLASVLMVVKFGFLGLPDVMDHTPPPEAIGASLADMLQRAFGTEFGNSEAGRAVMRELFERNREFLASVRTARQVPRSIP